MNDTSTTPRIFQESFAAASRRRPIVGCDGVEHRFHPTDDDPTPPTWSDGVDDRTAGDGRTVGYSDAHPNFTTPRAFRFGPGIEPEENSGRVSPSTQLNTRTNLFPSRAESTDIGHDQNPTEGQPRNGSGWLSLLQISKQMGVTKNTARKMCEGFGWKSRRRGNRIEFHCPLPEPDNETGLEPNDGPQAPSPVTFAQLKNGRTRERVLMQQRACELYAVLAESHSRKEAQEMVVREFPGLSTRTLRRIWPKYEAEGINGLVPQQQGRVGRPSVASKIPEHVIAQARAADAEYSYKVNAGIRNGGTARAYRYALQHPDTPGELAEAQAERMSGKSYMPLSVRRAITTSPMAKEALVGRKNMRLKGAFTPLETGSIKANQRWTADDMTVNVYTWTEWPGATGWKIMRAQLLAVFDCGTRKWIGYRLIYRERGQYNGADVWATLGDCIETHGLPDEIVLEGGIWQSDAVRGKKVRREVIAEEFERWGNERSGKGQFSNVERIGGLESLGVKCLRSYTPRTKPIEGAFNVLQQIMDRCPGYAGRNERKDRSEKLREMLAMTERKTSPLHPRSFLMHRSQLNEWVMQAMQEYNTETQDGKTLRGLSPVQKWAEDAPAKREIPAAARHLFANATAVNKVTSNGFLITKGSGASRVSYYFDLWDGSLVQWQGQSLMAFYDERDMGKDIVLCETNGEFVGVARLVKAVDPNGGDPTVNAEERERRKARERNVSEEIGQFKVFLQRDARHVIPHNPDDSTAQTGEALRRVNEDAAAKRQTERTARRAVNEQHVTDEELDALMAPSREQATEDDDIERIFE